MPNSEVKRRSADGSVGSPHVRVGKRSDLARASGPHKVCRSPDWSLQLDSMKSESLELLILDSPTVGVDIANKAGIYHIISDLAAHGIAVLMICDEIEEAWYQSHRILVMKQGELTHSFLPDSSTQQQIAEVVNG